jgi:transcriptional regulator with XRE-family HTH domain
MTPDQARMARAALKLTVRDVEELSGVKKDTVSRFEAGKEIGASAFQRLEKLYLAKGVIFLNEDAEGGQGVRLPNSNSERAQKKHRVETKSGKRSQKTK